MASGFQVTFEMTGNSLGRRSQAAQLLCLRGSTPFPATIVFSIWHSARVTCGGKPSIQYCFGPFVARFGSTMHIVKMRMTIGVRKQSATCLLRIKTLAHMIDPTAIEMRAVEEMLEVR